MDLSELLEDSNKDLVIIYPGRFHPFHIGHGKVYKYLKQRYSNAKVFIATSGKTDGDRSPFTFEEKRKMMILAGVDSSAIVQTKSPYQAVEIMERFDKDKTVVVFAISEKDMATEPRFDFSGGTKLKKNGEPTYLQKWNGLEDAETFGTRGYIATTPTFKFKVRGQEINSASQIRNMIASSDDTMLTQMLQDLYSVTDVPQDIIDLFKNKVGNKETMNENWDEHSFSKFLKENVIEDNIMKNGILKTITEGKSPHKKGTKKYNAHMAAMHAESIDEEFDRKVKEIVESKMSVAADIKDYVDDHKEHFDAYPMDVEVDDKMYDYDEYWEILDKVYPGEYTKESVNEEKQIRAKEGDYEFGKDLSNDISFVTYKGQVISQGDFDQGADGWFMWIPGVEGQEFFSKPEDVVAYFSKHNITEEVNEEITRADYRSMDDVRTGHGEMGGQELPWQKKYKPASSTNAFWLDGIKDEIAKHNKGKAATGTGKDGPANRHARPNTGPGDKTHLKNRAVSEWVQEPVNEDDYANDQHEMLEYIHHVLQECGDGNMDITMVEQAIGYVEDIREQHFDAGGSTKSESTDEFFNRVKDRVKTINLPMGNLKNSNLKEWLKEDAEAEEKVSTLTKMQKVYNHNEDRNAHSENILMLAQAFGDRGEIKAIEGLLSTTKRQGYVTPEQSEIMYNSIHKKYIKELFPLNEVWPALAVAGAAGYGLYKGGKKAGKYLANKAKAVTNFAKDVKDQVTGNYNPVKNSKLLGFGETVEVKSVDIMTKAMKQSIDEDDSWKLWPADTAGKNAAKMKAQAQDDSWKLTGTEAARKLWYGSDKSPSKSVAKGTGKGGPANRHARPNTGPGDKTHLKNRAVAEGPADKTQLRKRAAKLARAKQHARDSEDFQHDSAEDKYQQHKSQQAGVTAASDYRSDKKGVVATAKAVAQQNAVKKANKQNKAADATLIAKGTPAPKSVAKGTGALGPVGGAKAPVRAVVKPGRTKTTINKDDLFGKGSDDFDPYVPTVKRKAKTRNDVFKGADLGHKGNWVESILHYSDAKGTTKYKEGYKAARTGVKYDENPYSGSEKLQWSKGHNDFRADKMSADGEPNYGARGQFESK